MNKKKWIIGGLAAWFTLNAVFCVRNGVFTRLNEMSKKHNGNIPFTLDNMTYIFAGSTTK